MKKFDEFGQTGHKQAPADDSAKQAPGDDAMSMGMTGKDGGPDPDQKSTHVAPKTAEATLPDGSPKYVDAPPPKARSGPTVDGRYEVVGRISVKVDGKPKIFEPGEFVELEAAEATSLGSSVKLAQ
jgi:hypothetical protein